MPTLTSDVIGQSAIFNGHTFNVSGCTGLNYTACGAVSNRTTNTVIPPAMSARLTTRASHAIRFGRVEIRAKLPRGDWLWPALWMLPKDNIYGEWPLSGEIDVSVLFLVYVVALTWRSGLGRLWSRAGTARRTRSRAAIMSAGRSTGSLSPVWKGLHVLTFSRQGPHHLAQRRVQGALPPAPPTFSY